MAERDLKDSDVRGRQRSFAHQPHEAEPSDAEMAAMRDVMARRREALLALIEEDKEILAALAKS